MDGCFLFDEILFQMKLVSHKRFLLKQITKCWFQVELDEILGGGQLESTGTKCDYFSCYHFINVIELASSQTTENEVLYN
jgi:hypothetical protein